MQERHGGVGIALIETRRNARGRCGEASISGGPLRTNGVLWASNLIEIAIVGEQARQAVVDPARFVRRHGPARLVHGEPLKLRGLTIVRSLKPAPKSPASAVVPRRSGALSSDIGWFAVGLGGGGVQGDRR